MVESPLERQAEHAREILGARLNDGHELRPYLLTLLEYIDSLKTRCYYMQDYAQSLESGLEELRKSIVQS